MASPVLLSGCGSGAGDVNVGGGSAVGVGRASVLLGTYKSVVPASSGAVEETVLEFAPGKAFETLAGSYSYRVLAPRADGKDDILSLESGKLAGRIGADGSLEVRFTPDTFAGEDRHRAAPAGTQRLTYTTSGSTLTNTTTGETLTRFQPAPVSASKPAVTLSGAWSGGTADTGLQLTNPLIVGSKPEESDVALPGLPNFAIALNYTSSSTVTLSSTQLGTATAQGTVHIYSEYDGNIPTNFAGVPYAGAGQYFVVGGGNLPSNAPTYTIPGTGIPVPLANRGFLFEAGGGDAGSNKFQIGTLYVQLTNVEAAFAAIKKVHVNIDPQTAAAYVQIGTFYILKGGSTPTPSPSPTPTPTPSPGAPAVGTVQFSNVSSPTNATTTAITKTQAAASFSGNILNASLTDSSGVGTVERDLSIQLGVTSDDSSLAVGKTFPISSGTVSTGKASVSYIESAGTQRFWLANGGTVKVIAHDSQHTTLQVIGATMVPLNNNQASGTNQPIGTFTINAAGKF